MKKIIAKIIPAYAYIPLISVLSFNCLVYYGARLFNSGRVHYSLKTGIDEMIPFLPFFVVFYILAFAQWAAGYLLMARESRETCYLFCSADLIAKLLTFICFLIVPTCMERPVLNGNGIWDRLVGMIYSTDAADNLFPSIHCLESWMCFQSSFYLRKVPRVYILFSLLMTLLVCASTVCLKQHLFVDIPAGILAAQIGIWAARHFKIYKIFGIRR